MLFGTTRPYMIFALLGYLVLQSLLSPANGSEPKVMQEDESVTLHCPVNKPMGRDVRKVWRMTFRDQEERDRSVILVRERPSRGVSWNEDVKGGKSLNREDFSLTLDRLRVKDSGDYTCEVLSKGVRQESIVRLIVFIKAELFTERKNNCTSETTLVSTVTCTVPRTFPELPPEGGLIMTWGNKSVRAEEVEIQHGAYKYTVAHQVTVTETTAAVRVTCEMDPVHQQRKSRSVTIRPTDVLGCSPQNNIETGSAEQPGIFEDSSETESIPSSGESVGRVEPVLDENYVTSGVPVLGLALGLVAVVIVSLAVSAIVVSSYRRRKDRSHPPKVNMPEPYSENGAVRYIINDKGPSQPNSGHFSDTYLAPEHFGRRTPQFNREKELFHCKMRNDSDSDEEGIYSMPDLPPIPVPPALPAQHTYSNLSSANSSSRGRL